jgi:hypothetical protein
MLHAAQTAAQTKHRWGERPREPASQAKQICKPTPPDSPAKIRNSPKTLLKIPANSRQIPTNGKATPIHRSLANNLASNPAKASNPVNLSNQAKAKVNKPGKVNNLATASNPARRMAQIPPNPMG